MTINNVFLKTLKKPLENPIGLFGLPVEMKFLNVSDIMAYEEKFLKTRNIKGKLDKTISNTVYGQVAISIIQMQGKFTVLFPWGKQVIRTLKRLSNRQ